MPHIPIFKNIFLVFSDRNTAFMLFRMNQQYKIFPVDYDSTISLLLTQLWFQEKYKFDGFTMQVCF